MRVLRAFLIVGWWLAVLQGQPPQLGEAKRPKRLFPSRHGGGLQFLFSGVKFFEKLSAGRDIFAKSNSFPIARVNGWFSFCAARVGFQQVGWAVKNRVGFVSAGNWIRERESPDVVFGDAVYRHSAKGNPFLKLNSPEIVLNSIK